MKKLTLFLGVVIIGASACQTNKTEFSKEIAVLDSLKADLMELKTSVAQFDLDKLHMIDSIAAGHARTLNQGIQDTLTKDEWMLLGNYTRTINKRLDKFEPKINKLRNQIDTSLKKMDDLAADLEHNSWSREQAMKYLQTETEKCSELVSATERMKEHAAMAMEAYHAKHEQVDSLMNAIEERMNASTEN